MKKRRGWKRFCIVMVCLIVFGSIPGYALNGGDAEGAENAKIGYSLEQALASERNGQSYKNINTLKGTQYDEIVPEEDWYCITDAEGLVRFATLVNSGYAKFQSMNVCLGSDIDMSEVKDFTAIGAVGSYHGVFDGCGYKIEKLVMIVDRPDTKCFVSLFGMLSGFARIWNLVIDSSCQFTYSGKSEKSYTAAIASRVTDNVEIKNVMSLADVSGGYYSGGIVAKLEPNQISTKTGLLNCSNGGSVSGLYAVGGIIGQCSGGINIQLCRNTGNVTALPDTAFDNVSAGGIMGIGEWLTNPDLEIDDSKRKVKIDLNQVVNCGNIASPSNAGGLIGMAKIVGVDQSNYTSFDLIMCINEGSVSATSENGKSHTFIGDADGTVDFTGCTDRSDEVRLHGSQVRLEEGNQTFGVRFIGSISTLEYREIGFNVTIKWGNRTVEKTFKCDVAFSSIETAGKDGVEYTAEALRGSDPAYLYAVTVSDIPMDAGTVEFCIAPYGIRTGKTEPEVGEECTVIYCNGEFVPTWERAVA